MLIYIPICINRIGPVQIQRWKSPPQQAQGVKRLRKTCQEYDKLKYDIKCSLLLSEGTYINLSLS